MPAAKKPGSASKAGVTEDELILLLKSAYVWMKADRVKTAEAVLAEVCALAPRWHSPWLARALLAEQREEYREALVMLRAAQRLAGGRDGDLIHMHLGELLLCLGKPDEARKEFSAAASSGNVAGRWATLRLGQMDQARRR